MSKNTTKDLTQGSPLRLILGFMLPTLFGLLFQQFYNLVDTAVVGKFLGMEALAGVGSTGSINFLVLGFCSGICSGFAIPIAQKFGEGDHDGLRRFVGNVLWLALGLALVITTAVCLLCRHILTWMNTPPEAFGYAYEYVFIVFLGIPVMMAYNILAGIIRSLGDSKTPVYFLMISSFLNIFLDVLLIFVFDMGVAGVAWATVIAQLISGLLCFLWIVKRFDILRLSATDLRPSALHMKRLCLMGLPMGLQYSITAVGSIFLQASINGLGALYMAAVTTGNRVGNCFTTPLEALGITMATYGGQNVGARKYDRIKSGYAKGCMIGIVYSLAALVVLFFFGDKIALLFTDQPELGVPQLAHRFLIVNAASYILLVFVNVTRFLIQGIGFAEMAIFAGLFEMVARAGVALGFVPHFGFNAVCFASPAAWLLADFFLVPLFFWCMRKLYKRQKDALTV